MKTDISYLSDTDTYEILHSTQPGETPGRIFVDRDDVETFLSAVEAMARRAMDADAFEIHIQEGNYGAKP